MPKWALLLFGATVTILILSIITLVYFRKEIRDQKKSPIAATTAMQLAKKSGSETEDARKELEKFNIVLTGVVTPEEGLKFIKRIQKNKEMKSFLEMARRNDIDIFLDNEFDIFRGGIWIDERADDARIIQFLKFGE